MGIRAVDPQSIRNVTIVGEPAETTRVVRRLLRDHAGTPAATVVHRVPGRGEHTIRVAELSSHAPLADLERTIRVADGAVVVLNAATARASRFETILRVADDHQVARLCLVTGLDHPAADFDRCVRAIAETRGARPLTLHLPLGAGAGFDGVIDLVPMWALEPMAAESYGSRWQLAEQWYRDLVAAVTDKDDEVPDAGRAPRKIPPPPNSCTTGSAPSRASVRPSRCCATRRGTAVITPHSWTPSSAICPHPCSSANRSTSSTIDGCRRTARPGAGELTGQGGGEVARSSRPRRVHRRWCTRSPAPRPACAV